jgi:hypothetical protein
LLSFDLLYLDFEAATGFRAPDEEMKRIVLKVIQQCVATAGVEPDSSRSLNRMQRLLIVYSMNTNECQIQKYGTIKKCFHDSQKYIKDIRLHQIHNEMKQDTIGRYMYVVYSLLEHQAILPCSEEYTRPTMQLREHRNMKDKKDKLLRTKTNFTRFQKLFTDQSMEMHNSQIQKLKVIVASFRANTKHISRVLHHEAETHTLACTKPSPFEENQILKQDLRKSIIDYANYEDLIQQSNDSTKHYDIYGNESLK